MVDQSSLVFAGLLRQLRADAKLTQEELAEAAGLSPRSVSDLERGVTRTTHKDTALLLAGALGLEGPARELFVAAAAPEGSRFGNGRDHSHRLSIRPRPHKVARPSCRGEAGRAFFGALGRNP